MWIDSDVLVFGFLIESANPGSAQKKLLRLHPEQLVKRAEVERALDTLKAARDKLNREVGALKHDIIEQYKETRQYEKDYLENLRPEIEKSVSFLHDYRQFIARVRQNINVVIETRNAGEDFDQKLQHALPQEAAIYWASILMEEKLKTAFLLLNPEQITNLDQITLFRLHGAVLKYVRIYNAAFVEKNISLRVAGESVGLIRGNAMAVPVIPHTLIDNALKYSPRDSDVRLEFRETEREIELKVLSYGPQIGEDERDKIFEIFYRGRDARRQEEEGSGFGLYLAQFIAKQLGTSIQVEQSPVRTRFGYLTTFFVRFRREQQA